MGSGFDELGASGGCFRFGGCGFCTRYVEIGVGVVDVRFVGA